MIVAVVGLAVLFFRSPRKTWSSTSMLWGTVTLLVGACGLVCLHLVTRS